MTVDDSKVTREEAIEMLKKASRALDTVSHIVGEHLRNYSRDEWAEEDEWLQMGIVCDDTLAPIFAAVGETYLPTFSPEDRAAIDDGEYDLDDEEEEWLEGEMERDEE